MESLVAVLLLEKAGHAFVMKTQYLYFQLIR